MKRLIRVGNSVIIGGDGVVTKTRHFKGSSVTYDKEVDLVVGELTIVSYNMHLQSVTAVDSNGEKVEIPFSIQPLRIGPYGFESYLHPSMLKFSHSGFIEALSDNNLCIHRVTGQKCRLILDSDFINTGSFRLEAISGPEKTSRSFKSEKWDRRTLRDYLDSIKGKVIKGKAKIGYLIYKDACHESVLVNPGEDLVVVLVFEDGTAMSLPYKNFQSVKWK